VSALPESLASALKECARTWAVTGVAGFIGSHLLETLLQHDQHVAGLDDLSTGTQVNLKQVLDVVSPAQKARFQFIKGDIRNSGDCQTVCRGAEVVLHHAATASVPLSIERPRETFEINVMGFANILAAARDQKVKRCVYASSSSVYGDDDHLPKVEERTGRPLSPYAQSKRENEEWAEFYARLYGTEVIGLRYFNVFGARQNPKGPYAGVIAQWIHSLNRGEPVHINGDGSTSRDFCHIENVVQANILAALTTKDQALGQVYNIALGSRTTLNELFQMIHDDVTRQGGKPSQNTPHHRDFRPGDIRHSHADISKARKLLSYVPSRSVKDGLEATVACFLATP